MFDYEKNNVVKEEETRKRGESNATPFAQRQGNANWVVHKKQEIKIVWTRRPWRSPDLRFCRFVVVALRARRGMCPV